MDGKRKKNKKKKGGSQSKLAVDVQSATAQEVVVPEQDDGASPHVNHLRQVSSMTYVQSVGVSESDIELDRHKVYEERFAKLQEEVRQLQEEKNQWLQKEVSLEEKIKLLQNDVDSCIKKEAGLEEKLKNLQSGNDSFIQKEAILEDRVKHVEGIEDSWILKETMINEMASKLDEVNIRLQEQLVDCDLCLLYNKKNEWEKKIKEQHEEENSDSLQTLKLDVKFPNCDDHVQELWGIPIHARSKYLEPG